MSQEGYIDRHMQELFDTLILGEQIFVEAMFELSNLPTDDDFVFDNLSQRAFVYMYIAQFAALASNIEDEVNFYECAESLMNLYNYCLSEDNEADLILWGVNDELKMRIENANDTVWGMFADGRPYDELQKYEDVRMIMIAGSALIDYYNGNTENERIKSMIYTCQDIEERFMGDIGKRLLAVALWFNSDEFRIAYQNYKGNSMIDFINDYLKRRSYLKK